MAMVGTSVVVVVVGDLQMVRVIVLAVAVAVENVT